jgi:hypothetical protein
VTSPATPRHPEDDVSIADSDELLRFVTHKPSHWTSEGKPSSAAFATRKGERGLSFALLSILADEGLDDLAPLEGRPGYGLVSLRVGDVRAHGCGVVRDPVVSETPREDDPAHCLVLYPPGVDKPELKLLRDSRTPDMAGC